MNAATRRQHPNAPLTPEGRRRMVGCVLDRGWTVEATAERFQVDAKTVRKWGDRWLTEGDDGRRDRSSRPHRSPNRTPRRLRRRVIRMRLKRRWGADHIGYEAGLAASTVQSIVSRAGLGHLDRGDRATSRVPVPRYQRDMPGALIHVDVKKLAGIPDGGGWRTRDRGYPGEDAASRRVGYRYLHTAVDDRSRIVYSEIHNDESAVTAAGFWARAATGTHVRKTCPYRPQTNGKVERFHRIPVEEWAYIRPRESDHQRTDAYAAFLHFYNHHRAHGALGWATPTNTIQDNLPEEHT